MKVALLNTDGELVYTRPITDMEFLAQWDKVGNDLHRAVHKTLQPDARSLLEPELGEFV